MLRHHRLSIFDKVFWTLFVFSIAIDVWLVFNIFGYCKVGLDVCEYHMLNYIKENIIFAVIFILHNLAFILVSIKYISNQLTIKRYVYSIYGILGICSTLFFWILVIGCITTRVL